METKKPDLHNLNIDLIQVSYTNPRLSAYEGEAFDALVDTVFTSSTGNFYDRSLLNSQFKRFLEKSNMPKLTLHGLRHTNASILINNGIGIKAVSAHLGHCNINITGDIYLHMFEEYKAKIADVMESNLI